MDTLLEKYILAAVAHGKATLEGDYKAANKQYSKLTKYYNQLEKDQPFAKTFLEKLFEHPNASVRTWAAAHALGLKILIDDAVSVLQQISQDQNIGVIRLDAELTLKQWTQQGGLKF